MQGKFLRSRFSRAQDQHSKPMDLLPCGISRFVHLAHRKISQNLFSCCKISLGNLSLTVQFLFPTSKKWPRKAACGTTPEITSLKHLGKKTPPAGGCFVDALLDLRVIFNQVYLVHFQNHPYSKYQVCDGAKSVLPSRRWRQLLSRIFLLPDQPLQSQVQVGY